jgi:phosphatidylinositol alpha-1,6-mannosyltransferase
MDIVLTQDFFPQVGGAHSWLYEVYRRWTRPVVLLTRAYDATPEQSAAAAAFDSTDHGALEIIRCDIAINDINLASPSCLRRLLAVRREILRCAGAGRATVHCLRAFPEGIAGLFYKLTRPWTRLVVFAHGEEILVAGTSRQLKLAASLVYRFADLVIANSHNTEAMVRTLCPVARTACVHPGVDAGAYSLPEETISLQRESWNWPADTFVLVTVSRMEPRKNQQAVIEAVAALHSEGLRVGYVCAGDGECRTDLERRAQVLGLGRWVRFPGAIDEATKISALCAMDAFVMLSVRIGEMIEGFGIVFLEAAAAGRPSICGDIGGQPEAVKDGVTGYVVDGRDVAAIAAAIRRVMVASPAQKEALTRASRAWAAENDWSLAAAAVRKSVDNLSPGRS